MNQPRELATYLHCTEQIPALLLQVFWVQYVVRVAQLTDVKAALEGAEVVRHTAIFWIALGHACALTGDTCRPDRVTFQCLVMDLDKKIQFPASGWIRKSTHTHVYILLIVWFYGVISPPKFKFAMRHSSYFGIRQLPNSSFRVILD